jgi:small subunit ribosomal protein S9
MPKTQYFAATGKRKTSIARVKLHEHGSGNITVNGVSPKQYFSGLQPEKLHSPLTLVSREKAFDVEIELQGGGKESQAEAARHGIARALIIYDLQLRPALKKAGFLRRDSRIRERKKPGLKRARRGPQWAKR